MAGAQSEVWERFLADGLAGLLGGIGMVATAGAGFDREARAERELAVGERLHQPPGEEARQDLGLAPQAPPPSRWSLRTIRASVAALADYSLSGVWRLLQRATRQVPRQVPRRPLRDHLYSPDPE